MKGCTDYAKEAKGWAHSQTAKPRFPRVFLLILLGIVVVLALILFFPRAPSETFSVTKQQDPPTLAAQTTQENAVEVSPDAKNAPADTEMTLVVYLTGAVANPGVLELKGGARINDAIIDAGGLREDAAAHYLNLAALATDGMHIHIPTQQEIESGEAARIELAGASGIINPAGGEDAQALTQKVNINKADKAELETLPGIGTATAQRIIDYREKNGPFATVEDLKDVSGIGDKKYEDLVDKVCV